MAKQSRCQTVCLTGIVLLCLVTIGFSVYVLLSLKTRDEMGTHKNIHLIVDDKHVRPCPPVGAPRTILDLPCFAMPNEYVNKEGGIGPLKCKDDYFDEEGGSSFCDTAKDTFHLNADRNAVVVQKPGIYRIYGQVTFKDKNEMHVDVLLRINEHSFIQCHQQNFMTGNDRVTPYTTCTLNGERRLREGDKVGLVLPNPSRTINSYHKTTFWGMVRMAD